MQHRAVRRGLDWARGSLPFGEFKRRFRARRAPDRTTRWAATSSSSSGGFPRRGSASRTGQFTYTVLRTEKRRILEVMIERMEAVGKKKPGVAPGLDV